MSLVLRVRVRLDRLDQTERSQFEGKEYTIIWEAGSLRGDQETVSLLKQVAVIPTVLNENPFPSAHSVLELAEDVFEIIDAPEGPLSE